MEQVKIQTTTKTEVTLNGHRIEDVLIAAKLLAHELLMELSTYRQRNNLDEFTFDCEGSACEFLDMIGD